MRRVIVGLPAEWPDSQAPWAQLPPDFLDVCFCMSDCKIKLLAEERAFEMHELFFSTTDSRGIIRHGNAVFTRISDYSESELIGAPHNIIRHPDMPRSVFKLLWDYLEAGRTIAAYVKNLAKDGRYYWVLAVVMPCPGGYLSIRLKPSSPLHSTVETLYRDTLAIEQRHEVSTSHRKQAMLAGLEHIDTTIKSLGFPNYDAFMWHALSVEMASRHAFLSKRRTIGAREHFSGRGELGNVQASCQRVESHLQNLFDDLATFRTLNDKLVNKSATILDMADAIYALSLNATIAAHRGGQTGAILAVAAEELGARAADNEQIIDRLVKKMTEFAPLLGDLIFGVAVAKLQSEVSSYYLRELVESGDESSREEMRESLEVLLNQLLDRCRDLSAHMKSCGYELNELATLVRELKRNARALRFVQFAGIKEAQQQSDSDSFKVVFQEVREEIQRTKIECEDLANDVAESLSIVQKIHHEESEIASDLKWLADFADLITKGDLVPQLAY